MGMTLEQIKESPRTYLTVEDVGRLVGIRPDMLRWQAQQDPQRLCIDFFGEHLILHGGVSDAIKEVENI